MKFSFNHRRALATLPALAGCAGLAVLYMFPPAHYQIYPRCPFYAVTHLLCPGCGGTRAMYELLHMNLPGALHYNALVTVLAPLALIWLAWGCYRFYRYHRFPPVPWPRSIALALGVIAISFACIRDAGIAFVI
jgi:hypothetical protein